jgi:hypothetical protein
MTESQLVTTLAETGGPSGEQVDELSVVRRSRHRRKGCLMVSRRNSLILASAAFLLGGCASMIHGPYETVRIESDPPGATANVSATQSERGSLFLDPQKQTVTTPATLRLRRDNTYRVELLKPGYKVSTTKVVSSYDWLWTPYLCGPCEAAGQLPTYDLKDQALPVRFLEAAFYEYPKGFFRAWGYAFRIFNPEALMGTSYKLAPEKGGFLSNWHALGEPTVTGHLDPS